MISASVRSGGTFMRKYVRARFSWSVPLLVVLCGLSASSAAEASTYRWQADASGNWNDQTNWELVEGVAGAGYPNLPGDVAVFDEPLTAPRTVTIPDTVTIAIGRLTVALSPAPGALSIANAGSGLTVFGEGHASSGLTTTALNWSLAEGRVGGPHAYTTYILLANPQSSDATVKVTFLRESGTPVVKTYGVAANTRFNIDVGGMVPELQNESFGAFIEVTNDVPIAVERSMYWNVEGRFWSGGTNAVGSVVVR